MFIRTFKVKTISRSDSSKFEMGLFSCRKCKQLEKRVQDLEQQLEDSETDRKKLQDKVKSLEENIANSKGAKVEVAVPSNPIIEEQCTPVSILGKREHDQEPKAGTSADGEPDDKKSV